VINKVDLLPYVPFDLNQAIANARHVHPGIEVIETSCTKVQGWTRGWRGSSAVGKRR
jgi:hydrogenase nickel incorporation protein HypB